MGTPAQTLWQPSTARVVTVGGFGPFPRGTWEAPPEPLCWPAKDPGDTLDYVVDFRPAITGNESDAIATLDVTVSPAMVPADLQSLRSEAEGALAILWLQGGVSGTVYAVTVAVTLASGRALSRTVGLAVTQLSVPAAFGVDITDQTGAALTDQTGAPLTIS